jgi:uncharacterized protein
MSSIIANNEEEKKFYLRLDGKEAFLKYELKNGNIDLTSVYVPKEFRGKEIGEAILKEALSYAEKNELKVIPSCRFAKSFLKKNPEYQHLVA